MKVLLICENPLEKIGDEYYAVDSWMRFHLNLAKHCKKLTLLAPVIKREAGVRPASQSWRVDLDRLQIVDHDYYNTFVKYYRLWLTHARAWKQKARHLISEHDVVLIFHPSPMTSFISRIAKKINKVFVVFLVGDIKAQSDRILAHSGLKRFTYELLVNFWVRQEINSCKRAAFVYAYSQELVQRHHGKSKAIVKLSRDLHMSLDDFYEREDTCLNSDIRLIRVCWLIPSKGIEYLLEAVSLLVKKGIPVRLDLVGQERTPGYQFQLEQLIKRLGIEERVHFCGWIPFDRLAPIYIKSDIQVLSSLAEGTPRVIVEGAARGVPLVTTAVGGCPDVLQNEVNALLIPPADSHAMANAIERLIRNNALRKRLIRNGYDEARKWTFEHKGMELLEDLKKNISPSTI